MRSVALLIAISAARAAPPVRAAELSPFDRAVLDAALREAGERYDPAEAMIRGSVSRVGYHTTVRSGEVHPTRESMYYAAALLDAAGEENRDRATRILRRVIALQDQDPSRRTYGIWSWYLEEPLSKMSPPDWNWADFLGTALAHIALHRLDALPEADRRAVLDSLRHAAHSIRRRNVGPAYTNIAAKGTFVVLAAGEILGEEDLLAYGVERARRFAAHVEALGTFSEYNSPTYAAVTAMALARIRSDVRSKEARAAIAPIERLLWREIAETFHAPTMQWAGPHARSYATDLAGNAMARLLIQRATGGAVRFYPDDRLPGSLEIYRSPVACPPDLLPLFAADGLPRRIRRTFQTPAPGADRPPRLIATTYLGKRFALGSVNRFDLWNQRRAIVAYWGSPDALGTLCVRCLHDGYDFASAILGSVQDEGDVIAAVGFATDYGDTHVSLDLVKDGTIRAKDLRIRIEMRGSGSAPDPRDFEMGGVRIAHRIIRASFAGAEAPVEIARAGDGFDIDVILHRGEEKAIDLRAIDEACVAFALSIREDGQARGADPFAGLTSRAEDRILRIEWPREPAALSLTFPLRPGPIQKIQGATEGAIGGPRSLGRYYGHPAVEDPFGVIAPWHPGGNGPCDERVRIAADLYKRYPWVGTDRAVKAAPHIIYNTHWKIAGDGMISIPPATDWMCGDLSQRALSIIQGLTAHYAYSGDPLAFTYIPLVCDYILDHCLTGPDHAWPRFPVATPTRGKIYGPADPRVPNQLDLCACLGTEFLRAYRLTRDARYRDAALHWGDVIAEKRVRDPSLPPWNRYVSPEYMAWSDQLTAGTILIADFLDECIRAGHRGAGGAIVEARDAARSFVRESLLARWTENEVWGRHYWDWESPVYCGIVPWCCEYILDHPDAFPSWRTDVRNVLGLVFNRNTVSLESLGDVYGGAWAFPETSSCCETSLSYNQYTYAPVFLRYGGAADDAWAREIGRRMIIQATYDSLENGVVLDGLWGKVVAAGEWLNLAHPWPLCQALKAMAWAPEILAPERENHIVRSSSVVRSVRYEKGRIRYETSEAPARSVDLLRLSFAPRSVSAGGEALERRADPDSNGYTVKPLPGGDAIVTIRHDGRTAIAIEGDDPQEVAHGEAVAFMGNQVGVAGSVGPDGGLADVFLDGVRQFAPIDAFCPFVREGQILFARSGLSQGRHEIRIVPRGAGNPLSKGTRVAIEAIQFSAAAGEGDRGAGGGPAGAQRMIFGYTARSDYVDSRGNTWKPGLEFVARTGRGSDSVACSLWTRRRAMTILRTQDPEIYRYGLHGAAFRVNVTVAPGTYRVRLHFADTRTGARQDVSINGRIVLHDFAVAGAAGGIFRAVTREFGGIAPAHGIIEIGFSGSRGCEASVQAIEVEPE